MLVWVGDLLSLLSPTQFAEIKMKRDATGLEDERSLGGEVAPVRREALVRLWYLIDSLGPFGLDVHIQGENKPSKFFAAKSLRAPVVIKRHLVRLYREIVEGELSSRIYQPFQNRAKISLDGNSLNLA